MELKKTEMVKLPTESQSNKLSATSRNIQISRRHLDTLLPRGSKLNNIIMSLDGKKRENTNVMSSHLSALKKMTNAHAQMVICISLSGVLISKKIYSMALCSKLI